MVRKSLDKQWNRQNSILFHETIPLMGGQKVRGKRVPQFAKIPIEPSIRPGGIDQLHRRQNENLFYFQQVFYAQAYFFLVLIHIQY
jgi:hypothetical protein